MNEGNILAQIGRYAYIDGNEEDIAGEMEKLVDANTEEEADANKKEGEQDRETIWRREGWDTETAWMKESCTEKEGRAKEEQTDAERSGRRGGACHVPGGTWLNQLPWKELGGIGDRKLRGTDDCRNRPRPEKKQPLLGGAERRLNRNRRKPLKSTADPGELNERAATLQETRGLSRYEERYKGKRAGDGRPRNLKGFKSRLPPFPGEHAMNRSWEASEIANSEDRRLQKPLRPEKKQPLLGGAERRLNRNRRKPLKSAADPGEMNERAATLQVRGAVQGEAGRRWEVREKGKEGKDKGDTARGALRRKENKGGHDTGSTA
ncbi:hypothetical protein NDU88_002668 [Pleurodeles waltl]|uniref:Uncharacterized protein n=1 Tax=Pleurodeles waltl TaxID=8319 RepID=A0AAV7MY32_PLEWA|nr:hypothetical protein NDU88_002668 [Pleurodeles waltl]